MSSGRYGSQTVPECPCGEVAVEAYAFCLGSFSYEWGFSCRIHLTSYDRNRIVPIEEWWVLRAEARLAKETDNRIIRRYFSIGTWAFKARASWLSGDPLKLARPRDLAKLRDSDLLDLHIPLYGAEEWTMGTRVTERRCLICYSQWKNSTSKRTAGHSTKTTSGPHPRTTKVRILVDASTNTRSIPRSFNLTRKRLGWKPKFFRRLSYPR